MVNGQQAATQRQEAAMYSHPGSRQAKTRQRETVRRQQARAATAARRQGTLLAVVVTILFALLLALWAQQARAAVGDPAVSEGQVDETLDMAKSPREIFVGRWYGEAPVAGGVTQRWVGAEEGRGGKEGVRK